MVGRIYPRKYFPPGSKFPRKYSPGGLVGGGGGGGNFIGRGADFLLHQETLLTK